MLAAFVAGSELSASIQATPAPGFLTILVHPVVAVPSIRIENALLKASRKRLGVRGSSQPDDAKGDDDKCKTVELLERHSHHQGKGET
jgi:hypothetical protein